MTGGPAKQRRVAAALVVALVVALFASGCASIRDNARQRFRPKHDGLLTVATALPAPGFWDQDATGEVVGGFEFEIATELAEHFGLRLDIVEVPFDRIVQGDLGGADLAMSQISITDARRAHVAFSTPYHTTSAGVLATKGDEIRDLKTARERSWAVTAGSTEAAFVHDVVEPTADVVERPDDEATARAVADGTVDAALVDVSSALVLQQQFTGLDTVARFVTEERYGAAVPKGDDHNLQLIDAGLHALDADGTLRDIAGRTLAADTDPDRIPVIVTKG